MCNSALRKLIYPTLLAALAVTAGCKKLPPAEAICEDHPELCRGLNQGSWCKAERSSVVINEYSRKEENTDPNIYQALLAWEEYRDCIELAAHVEMKRLKIRQSQRVEGYIRAEEAIEDYLKSTTRTNHPGLLWYHWSRDGNKKAYRKFVRLEQSGQLNTPELVLNIAAHYAEEEKEIAVSYLLKAISMYEDEADIDLRIYRQLTTLLFQLEDYRHSYIWALITKEKEPEVVDMSRLDEEGKLTIHDKHQAERFAGQILAQLSEPGFKPKRAYPFK